MFDVNLNINWINAGHSAGTANIFRNLFILWIDVDIGRIVYFAFIGTAPFGSIDAPCLGQKQFMLCRWQTQFDGARGT